MPKTRVLIYQDRDGKAPVLEWLDGLPDKVQDKFVVLAGLLRERGHNLRRPYCDLLKEGIYELRARRGHVNYRILYGFVGEKVVLLSHGCTKEREVPPGEIKRAVRNLDNYRQNQQAHTYTGNI